MKILFLAPYPLDHAPSQRFRFEQFFKFMEEKGWEMDFQPFVSEKGWRKLYVQDEIFRKVVTIFSGSIRRFRTVFKVSKFDVVFIHRELTPFGPPIFEWIIAKILKKKILSKNPDGYHYTRMIAGEPHEKMIIGTIRGF